MPMDTLEKLRGLLDLYRGSNEARELHPQLEILRKPLVGVMGRTGAGKSSWLNAICNTPGMLPVSHEDQSYTSFPHLISAGQDDDFHVTLHFTPQTVLVERVKEAKGLLDRCRQKNKSELRGDNLIFQQLYDTYEQTSQMGAIEDLYRSLPGLSRTVHGLDLESLKTLLIHHSPPGGHLSMADTEPEAEEEDSEEELLHPEVQEILAREKSLTGSLWVFVNMVEITLPRTSRLPAGMTLADLPGLSDNKRFLSTLASDFLEQCTEIWILDAQRDRDGFRSFLKQQRELIHSLEGSAFRVVITKQEDCLDYESPAKPRKRKSSLQSADSSKRVIAAKEKVIVTAWKELEIQLELEHVFLCRGLGSGREPDSWSDLSAQRAQLRRSVEEYEAQLADIEQKVRSLHSHRFQPEQDATVTRVVEALDQLDPPEVHRDPTTAEFVAMLRRLNYQTMGKIIAMKGRPWQCSSKNTQLRDACEASSPNGSFTLSMADVIFRNSLHFEKDLNRATTALEDFVHNHAQHALTEKERDAVVDCIHTTAQRVRQNISIRETEWMSESVAWERIGATEMKALPSLFDAGVESAREKVQQKLREWWTQAKTLIMNSMPAVTPGSPLFPDEPELEEISLFDWIKRQDLPLECANDTGDEDLLQMEPLSLRQILVCVLGEEAIATTSDDQPPGNLYQLLLYVHLTTENEDLPILCLRFGDESWIVGDVHPARSRLYLHLQDRPENMSFLTFLQPMQVYESAWFGGHSDCPLAWQTSMSMSSFVHRIQAEPAPQWPIDMPEPSATVDQSQALEEASLKVTKSPWKIVSRLWSKTRMLTIHAYGDDYRGADHDRMLSSGVCVGQAPLFVSLHMPKPDDYEWLHHLKILLDQLAQSANLYMIRVCGAQAGKALARMCGYECASLGKVHFTSVAWMWITMHHSEIPDSVAAEQVLEYYDKHYAEARKRAQTQLAPLGKPCANGKGCANRSVPMGQGTMPSRRLRGVVLTAPIKVNLMKLPGLINRILDADAMPCQRAEALPPSEGSQWGRYRLCFTTESNARESLQRLDEAITIVRLLLGFPEAGVDPLLIF